MYISKSMILLDFWDVHKLLILLDIFLDYFCILFTVFRTHLDLSMAW